MDLLTDFDTRVANYATIYGGGLTQPTPPTAITDYDNMISDVSGNSRKTVQKAVQKTYQNAFEESAKDPHIKRQYERIAQLQQQADMAANAARAQSEQNRMSATDATNQLRMRMADPMTMQQLVNTMRR